MEKWQLFLNWFEQVTNHKISKYIGTGDTGIVFECDNHVIKFSNLKIDHLQHIIGKKISGIVFIYEGGLIKVKPEFQHAEGELFFSNNVLDNQLHLELSDDDFISYIIMEKMDLDINSYLSKAVRAYNESCNSELLELYYMDYDTIEDILDVLDTYNLQEFLITHTQQLSFSIKEHNTNEVLKYFQSLIDDHHEESAGLQNILDMNKMITTAMKINPQYYDFHFSQLGKGEDGTIKIFDIFNTTIKDYSGLTIIE